MVNLSNGQHFLAFFSQYSPVSSTLKKYLRQHTPCSIIFFIRLGDKMAASITAHAASPDVEKLWKLHRCWNWWWNHTFLETKDSSLVQSYFSFSFLKINLDSLGIVFWSIGTIFDNHLIITPYYQQSFHFRN